MTPAYNPPLGTDKPGPTSILTLHLSLGPDQPHQPDPLPLIPLPLPRPIIIDEGAREMFMQHLEEPHIRLRDPHVQRIDRE